MEKKKVNRIKSELLLTKPGNKTVPLYRHRGKITVIVKVRKFYSFVTFLGN